MKKKKKEKRKKEKLKVNKIIIIFIFIILFLIIYLSYSKCKYSDNLCVFDESESAGNCFDEIDNDCDGECDYDGCSGAYHGDIDCPVNVV